VVAVVAEVVVEIISTLVAVGRGGDYLDTSSGSSSRDNIRGEEIADECCGNLSPEA
jgi:hypothetical protein